MEDGLVAVGVAVGVSEVGPDPQLVGLVPEADRLVALHALEREVEAQVVRG